MTPTASGKSLCYNLPVLQAIAEDPAARALYLFPTKALSQDQLAEVRELAGAGRAWTSRRRSTTGTRRRPSAPSSARPARSWSPTRTCSSTAILPHHTKWFQLFEQLRYIVIDEAHTYRGIFGSHVANVLRRLLRICAHYGSAPRIVCCSATIGNPGRAGRDADRPPRPGHRPQRRAHRARSTWSCSTRRRSTRARACDPGRTGSPIGPPWRSCAPAARPSSSGAPRVAVELLLTVAARGAARGPRAASSGCAATAAATCPASAAPSRPACAAARSWASSAPTRWSWASTSGGWTSPILAGYPGTIAGDVAADGPRRAAQDVSVADPRRRRRRARPVRGDPPGVPLRGHARRRRAWIPENIHVLLAHLRAATFELPFDPGERFGSAAADDLLAFLAEEGHVRQADDGRWYWASENFPASEISLRVAAPENVLIIDTGPERPRVIGEVDLFAARDARPRERHLPARVAPVPRRPARLGGAQGATCARSTSTTTRRRSWPSRSSRWRSSTSAPLHGRQPRTTAR